MVAIFICFVIFIFGYLKPRIIGWILLSLSPLLVGISNLIFYTDILFPLRWEQIIFAGSFGIAFSKHYFHRIKYIIFNIWPIFILLIYVLVSVIYGLIDPHITLFKWFFLQEYISYFAVVVLSFALIQSYDDLLKFKRILLWSVAIIVFLIFLEMITKFNLPNYLCFLNIEFCDLNSLHFNLMDNDYIFGIQEPALRRYAGYTGDPNLTAITLSMFMIFIIHSLYIKNNSILVLIFLFVCICTLFIGQTRAAIFSFLLVLFTYSIFKYKLVKYLFYIFLLILFSYILIDSFNTYINSFIENRLLNGNSNIEEQRMPALIKALEVIKESFGLGVGGTIFSVSEKYLNDNDTTGYILHFLVGGFPFLLIYITLLISLIYDLVKFKESINIIPQHKLLVEMSILGLIIGMITQIFNENSIMFYYLLLYSTARSSLWIRK
jgi:hypothetical protein